MPKQKALLSLPASGFSLVEVLVALLVLSIGLLGAAALQTTGLKFSQQSYQRTQATIQAYDMLDRIRANKNGKLAGYYDTVADGSIPSIALDYCNTNTCSALELANFDIANWNTSNANLLAQGTGQIETAGSIRTVTIRWIENDLKMSLVVEAEL